jgi:hypothetical protein
MADIIIHFSDAAIFSLCAAVSALQVRKTALVDTIPNASERYLAIGAINVEQDSLINWLADLRAITLEARCAPARVLSLLSNTQLRGGLPSCSWISQLTAAGIRDLTAEMRRSQ